ncbi:MAG: hypothetical protein ACPG7F_15595 [Aggregatilineales bacterium]
MTTIENTKPKHRPRRRWRLILKIALLAFLLFVILTAARILIPALQYRDAVMTLLHYSDDCHAPCFMGITPGQTTESEAIEILENHEWVEDFGYNDIVFGVNWRQDAPQILQGTQGEVYVVDNRVDYLMISAEKDIPFLSFVLFQGLPDTHTLSRLYNNWLDFRDEQIRVFLTCFQFPIMPFGEAEGNIDSTERRPYTGIIFASPESYERNQMYGDIEKFYLSELIIPCLLHD